LDFVLSRARHALIRLKKTLARCRIITSRLRFSVNLSFVRYVNTFFSSLTTTKIRKSKKEKMMGLKGSKTEGNLKAAFAGESQANRRYLYFAAKADVEGQNDVAAVFRSTAEGETGHAHGHLEYLENCGDPATGMPFGASRDNLKTAIAGETHEYTDMYPGMAKTARDEGFDEIADWFETLAKAERSHANRFQRALDSLAD
jgi:rubrerythrin